MRVLYNASSARVGGGLSYCRHQIAGLAAVPDVHLTVITSDWNHDLVAATRPDVVELIPSSSSSVLRRFLWEQVRLPRVARTHDVLISPGNFATWFPGIAQAVVLQNPNYVGRGRRLPQNAPWRRRAKIAFSLASLRRADLVVSISDSLTEEIRREPRLAGIRLATVRSGSPDVDVVTDEDVKAHAEVAGLLVPPGPFVLSVANDYPHKRLEDLGSLAKELEGGADAAPRRVVFVGDIPEHRREAIVLAAGHAADRLTFLGVVADRNTVHALYRLASVAVSTSELESWGLTLHEAGALGTPLVVTDIPPHRELADGHATFVPVGDIDALIDAVRTVSTAARPEPWSAGRTWRDHGVELAAALRELVR